MYYVHLAVETTAFLSTTTYTLLFCSQAFILISIYVYIVCHAYAISQNMQEHSLRITERNLGYQLVLLFGFSDHKFLPLVPGQMPAPLELAYLAYRHREIGSRLACQLPNHFLVLTMSLHETSIEPLAQGDDTTRQSGAIAAGKRKRVLTEDRKKQNREAQRRYRRFRSLFTTTMYLLTL